MTIQDIIRRADTTAAVRLAAELHWYHNKSRLIELFTSVLTDIKAQEGAC